MTTITALNVRLGMDVSNFSEGANLAKGEVTKVATIMRQSVPPAEKYRQELELLNKSFSDVGKQSAQYANAVEFLNQKHKQGKYSAEEVAKAERQVAEATAAAAQAIKQARLDEAAKKQADLARATEKSAMAAKRAKEETAHLARLEQQRLATMERGRQLMLSVATAQEAHNRRVREYNQLLKTGAINQETFDRAVKKSNQTMKESGTSANGMLSAIKGMAAAYVGFQTITKAINLAAQVQDATIAFEVLTGSAEKGAILFEQIRKFAAESPVTFSGATEAAKTMLSFGVAVEDVAQNLRMLSDVTGGNNDRFKMLSLAFSQTTAAGRLMGQDLLQMINAGFNPLQQISKTTGESLIDLKKRMEDGGISAEEVRQAFQDATAEGGMFHGMTERLSETVSGKLNIALSDLEKKLAEAGEAMGPLVIQLLDAFDRMKPEFDKIIWLVEKISLGLGFALAVWTDLVNSFVGFKIDTTEIDKFLDAMEKREREAAEAKNKQIAAEFEKKIKNVDNVAAAERKAAKETEAAAEKLTAKRIANTLNETDELVRKAKADAKKAEQDWQRELEAARGDAMKFFDDQKKKNDDRRKDVAKGPGTGMEAGSADAVKFAADIVNAGIAGGAVPEDVVLNRDIAQKTAEMLVAQREANATAKDQLRAAEKMLDEMKENGFRRIR